LKSTRFFKPALSSREGGAGHDSDIKNGCHELVSRSRPPASYLTSAGELSADDDMGKYIMDSHGPGRRDRLTMIVFIMLTCPDFITGMTLTFILSLNLPWTLPWNKSHMHLLEPGGMIPSRSESK
jgi:hypothetical protein